MGYNLKPLDLQGAIGLVQLEKFDEIEQNRKVSKSTIEGLFLENIKGILPVKSLEKSDVSWFGTPFICEDYNLKSKLIEYLEENKIQTRNYFAGNILIHPGFQFLDNYIDYPESNKVLDKVFFIGASPHYNQDIFNYIEDVVKKFK
jgi:CDP-6-deoxy-D-xylo-4-hexulose-3-dehydrase